MSQNSELLELNELQSEALKEILNMGAGRAAASLSMLTGEHFLLRVPSVAFYTVEELEQQTVQGDHNRAIMLHLGGDLNGFTSLVFSLISAKRLLANTMDMEASDEEIAVLADSALMEIGNVVVGAIVGVFANSLGLGLQYSAPTLLEGSISELTRTGAIGKNFQILVAKLTFVDRSGQSEGYFMMVFDVASVEMITPSLDGFLESQGLL